MRWRFIDSYYSLELLNKIKRVLKSKGKEVEKIRAATQDKKSVVEMTPLPTKNAVIEPSRKKESE